MPSQLHVMALVPLSMVVVYLTSIIPRVAMATSTEGYVYEDYNIMSDTTTTADNPTAGKSNTGAQCTPAYVSVVISDDARLLGSCIPAFNLSCSNWPPNEMRQYTVFANTTMPNFTIHHYYGKTVHHICFRESVKNRFGSWEARVSVSLQNKTVINWFTLPIAVKELNDPPRVLDTDVAIREGYFPGDSYLKTIPVTDPDVTSSRTEWARVDMTSEDIPSELQIRKATRDTEVGKMDEFQLYQVKELDADNSGIHNDCSEMYPQYLMDIPRPELAHSTQRNWFKVGNGRVAFNFTIKVTDGGGLSSKANVTVVLTDINDNIPQCVSRDPIKISRSIYTESPIVQLGTICTDADFACENRITGYRFVDMGKCFGAFSMDNYGSVRLDRSTPADVTSCDLRIVAFDDIYATEFPLTLIFAECASDTDSKGRPWPAAMPGRKRYQSCPAGYEGNIGRKCTSDAVYDPPIYDCTSSLIQNILNEVIGTTTGSENVSVSSVLDQLTSATTPVKFELFPGDIVAVQAALVGITDIVRSRTNATDNQESNTDKFLDVANNLVDSRNAESWQSLMAQDGSGTDNVLGIIDSYAEILANAKRVDDDSAYTGDTGVESEYVKSNLMLKFGTTSTCNQQLEYPGRGTDMPAWITGTANRMQMSCTSVLFCADGPLHTIPFDRSVSNGSSINGPVMSFSLFPKTFVTLEDPIEISFQIFNKELTEPVCSYWNTNTSDGRGVWSTEGCTLRSHSKSDGVVVCLCNHLTNFAVLMSPAGSSEEHATALSIISAAGCSLSMLCLLLSFIVYIVYWRFVRCDRAIIHMHLFVCLFVAYALFLGGVTRTQIKALCTTIAALLHYVYLAVFMLMLTEGVDLGARILRASDRRRYWLFLLINSYAIPAVIVGVALVINAEGYGNEKFCWLSTTSGLIWAFIAPVLAIIMINGVLIVLVMKKMCATSSMQKKTDMERAKAGVRSICVLVPIMGVTWVFGVFSVSEDTVIFQYLFAICNSLQGLLIFIFHCLLNAKVQEGFTRTKARLFPSYTLSSEIHLPSLGRSAPTASTSISN